MAAEEPCVCVKIHLTDLIFGCYATLTSWQQCPVGFYSQAIFESCFFNSDLHVGVFCLNASL